MKMHLTGSGGCAPRTDADDGKEKGLPMIETGADRSSALMLNDAERKERCRTGKGRDGGDKRTGGFTPKSKDSHPWLYHSHGEIAEESKVHFLFIIISEAQRLYNA